MLRLCLRRRCARGSREVINGSDEAISASGQGFNKSRIVCRIPQRLANFVHRGIQSMLEIDEGISRPKALSQLLSRDQLARVRKKRSKNLKWLFLEFEAMPLPASFSAAQG